VGIFYFKMSGGFLRERVRATWGENAPPSKKTSHEKRALSWGGERWSKGNASSSWGLSPQRSIRWPWLAGVPLAAVSYERSQRGREEPVGPLLRKGLKEKGRMVPLLLRGGAEDLPVPESRRGAWRKATSPTFQPGKKKKRTLTPSQKIDSQRAGKKKGGEVLTFGRKKRRQGQLPSKWGERGPLIVIPEKRPSSYKKTTHDEKRGKKGRFGE